MGAWKRLFTLSKAAVNEALDKLEQPVMMMNHYLRSMEEEIHSLEQALVKETAAQRGLEQQIAGCNRLAEQSEQKAGEAMADDRMIEARQALEAKLAYLDRAAEHARACEAAKLRSAELEHRLQQAKAEYASMQAKRGELLQRAQKVQAQAQASAPSFSYGVEAGTAARGFQRIEETLLQKEVQIELENSMKAAAAASREALIQEQLTRLRNNNAAQQ
ncbi:MAG: hypothetical protein K0S39_108 [Paenibacillus sp.]|jgi:phage shock protein A/lia operon protein LiaH|nr:hypothetical protein [Paenibacillus sp.]